MTRRKKESAFLPDAIPSIISSYAVRISNPGSPSEWGELIDRELLTIWRDYCLTATERSPIELSDSIAPVLVVQRAIPEGIAKLDELIIREAKTLGWRIGLAAIVHWRFSCWTYASNGPTLFERYGKACADAARIFQGKRAAPVDDPHLKLLKKYSTAELRPLLRELQRAFAASRRFPTFISAEVSYR